MAEGRTGGGALELEIPEVNDFRPFLTGNGVGSLATSVRHGATAQVIGGLMKMDAIQVQDLRKDYGPVRAVAGVSFAVRSGEVFALLGPNGAGKTTTVEMLEGYRRRTGGSIKVLGFDPETGGRKYRDRIGIVPQEAGFEEEFTVRELVKYFRGMYSRRLGTDAVLELVGLSDKHDARVKTLSGGQRRRLDLALGIVGDPDVLFLDEPTTGFDPAARRHAWDLIEKLRNAGGK